MQINRNTSADPCLKCIFAQCNVFVFAYTGYMCFLRTWIHKICAHRLFLSLPKAKFRVVRVTCLEFHRIFIGLVAVRDLFMILLFLFVVWQRSLSILAKHCHINLVEWQMSLNLYINTFIYNNNKGNNSLCLEDFAECTWTNNFTAYVVKNIINLYKQKCLRNLVR